MKALITDADSHKCLTIARSLGRKGVDVTVAGERRYAMAHFSKYATRSVNLASPMRSPEQFVKDIIKLVKGGGYDVLFAVDEPSILAISKYREELSLYVRVPLAQSGVLDKAFDKEKTFLIAMENGISVPKTIFVKDIDDLKNISKTLQYPVIVKSRRSYAWNGDQIVSTNGLRFVGSAPDLAAAYLSIHKVYPYPLIQEFIPGEGYGVFALFNHGEPRVFFAHKRLREINPCGGSATLSVSIPLDPQLREIASRLLKAMSWHGVGMVELKRDSRDATYKLMEVNGRFWGSLPLAIFAGVDFPFILYDMAMKGDVEATSTYRIGLKSRWLRGDIVNLALTFLGPPKGWPYLYPKRLGALLNFFRFYQKNMNYYEFCVDDPLPAFLDLSEFLFVDIPSKIVKRFRR